MVLKFQSTEPLLDGLSKVTKRYNFVVNNCVHFCLGVLLLNACLTVKAANANSHQGKGWEELTDAVIKWISENSTGVVFLLWVSQIILILFNSHVESSMIQKKHHLLHAPHPSPLSAHRGFLGCKHFSKCNDLLVKQGKPIIEWGDLPPE